MDTKELFLHQHAVPMDTNMNAVAIPLITTQCETKPKSKSKPNHSDPIEWIGWFIRTAEPNTQMIKTTFADFELSISESKRVRLLNLCMYRVDDTPASHLVPQPVSQAVATHRRYLLIEYTIKELTKLKKENPEGYIHGLVIYRMNQELISPHSELINQSYESILKQLDSQKATGQQFYLDAESKSLCCKI